MKQDIHMKSHNVVFTCASCNNKVEIKSTLKDSEVAIDVCDKCHPFYIGSSVGQQVKGRAEKFSKKIASADTTKNKSDAKPTKKQNKKIINSLNNL